MIFRFWYILKRPKKYVKHFPVYMTFTKYIEFKLNLWFSQIVVVFCLIRTLVNISLKWEYSLIKDLTQLWYTRQSWCCKLGTQVCIRPLFQEGSKSWLKHVCILLLTARLDFTNSNFCGGFIYVNECICVLCFIMMKHIMPKICTTNMQNNTRPSLIKICAMTKETVIEEWCSGNKRYI